MAEDWAAVAKAINERVRELGWRQRELAERSHVSQAIVRELQHHTVERRRSARTLEALSTTLGWHPQHLESVLYGEEPPAVGAPVLREGDHLSSRLDAMEDRLSEITERLAAVQADLAKVVERTKPKR